MSSILVETSSNVCSALLKKLTESFDILTSKNSLKLRKQETLDLIAVAGVAGQNRKNFAVTD